VGARAPAARLGRMDCAYIFTAVTMAEWFLVVSRPREEGRVGRRGAPKKRGRNGTVLSLCKLVLIHLNPGDQKVFRLQIQGCRCGGSF
jgi:hypothetical protein